MNKKSVISIVVVVVVVTVATIIGALSLTRSNNAQQPAVSEPSEATTSAQVAPSESMEGVAKRPDCPSNGVAGVELQCLGGKQGSAGQGGKITVVNVWAWWCQPCREELPLLQDYAKRHPEVDVLGIHANEKAAAGADLLNQMNISLPSYQDGNNIFIGTQHLPAVIPLTLVFKGNERLAFHPQAFTSQQELDSTLDQAIAKAK